MKPKDLLEADSTKGTFVGIYFDVDTNKNIEEYIKANKIPNPILTEELHCTLIYGLKHLPNFKPLGKISGGVKYTIAQLEILKSRPDDYGKTSNVLVAKINSDFLVDRHNEIINEHDAMHDFDEYKPHFTLSYSVGDLDISELPSPNFGITIDEEYSQDLDLN